MSITLLSLDKIHDLSNYESGRRKFNIDQFPPKTRKIYAYIKSQESKAEPEEEEKQLLESAKSQPPISPFVDENSDKKLTSMSAMSKNGTPQAVTDSINFNDRPRSSDNENESSPTTPNIHSALLDSTAIEIADIECSEGKLKLYKMLFRNYCYKCEIPKPPRSHHCSICGQCIARMDHH